MNSAVTANENYGTIVAQILFAFGFELDPLNGNVMLVNQARYNITQHHARERLQ